MKKMKWCDVLSCCGGKGVELLGLVLVLIAAFLTIISLDSFGIVAMFLVGVILLAHKHCCRHKDESVCCDVEKKTTKAPAKKTPAKK